MWYVILSWLAYRLGQINPPTPPPVNPVVSAAERSLAEVIGATGEAGQVLLTAAWRVLAVPVAMFLVAGLVHYLLTRLPSKHDRKATGR